MNTKKTLFTTVALGAAYLLKNKGTRDKIMNGIQSYTSQSKAKNPVVLFKLLLLDFNKGVFPKPDSGLGNTPCCLERTAPRMFRSRFRSAATE